MSQLGTKKLKRMMRCLPRDLRVIHDRQTTVTFFSHPTQTEVARGFQGLLANIKNVPGCLRKMSNNQVKVRDWRMTVRSVANMITLCEMADHHHQVEAEGYHDPLNIPILGQLANCLTDEVRAVR